MGKGSLSLGLYNGDTILGVHFPPKANDHFLFLMTGISLLECIQSHLIKTRSTALSKQMIQTMIRQKTMEQTASPTHYESLLYSIAEPYTSL